jgi:tetratricopeptide (TPR) repeat protein
VEALHEGDYGLARRLLEQAYQSAPSDLGVLFFQAYALAWQGALNARALSADPAFIYVLDSIQTIGELKLRNGGEEGRASYYMGMAALMRARSHFDGGKNGLFKAASDARHGMRALERAIELGYAVPDASFWSGAYHAMASALPAPLRAVRFLVGIPGGSWEQALKELQLASVESRRFGVEASLFVAGALGERDEPDYVQAAAHVKRVLPEIARHGSLLPLFAGELLADWGLTPQARALWDAVLERRANQPTLYGSPEMARLQIDLAQTLVREQRWSEASAHLTAILEQADFGSPRLRQRASLLQASCQVSLGRRAEAESILQGFVGSDKIRRQITALVAGPLPDPKVEEQLSDSLRTWRAQGASAARPGLEEFVRQNPAHVGGRLQAGGAAFELRLDPEAGAHFRSILGREDAGEVSADARGWTHLYLGWLADRARRSEEAHAHYRVVERLKAFEPWRAGALYAQVSYPALPSRDADVWAFLRPAHPSTEGRAAGDP